MTVKIFPQEEDGFMGLHENETLNQGLRAKAESLGHLEEEDGKFGASLGYPVKPSQEKTRSKGTGFRGQNTEFHFLYSTEMAVVALMCDCGFFFLVVCTCSPCYFLPC